MMHRNKTDLWKKQTPFLEESYSFLRKPKCKSSLIGSVKNLEQSLSESHNKYEHHWEDIPVPTPMKCQLYSIWKCNGNEYHRDSVVPINNVSLMTNVQENNGEKSETNDILKEIQYFNKKGNLRKSSVIHHLIDPCTFDKVFPTHKNTYKREPKNEINACIKNISKKSETAISEITNDNNHINAVSCTGLQAEGVRKKISNKKGIRDEIKESLEYHGRKKLLRTIYLIQNNIKGSRRVKQNTYWSNFHQQKSQTPDVSPSQRWLQKFTCLKKTNQSYEPPETHSRNKTAASFRKFKGRHPSNVWHHHFSLGHRKYKNRRYKTSSDSQIENSFVKRKKVTVQHPFGYSSSTTDEPGVVSSSLIDERERPKKRSSKKVKKKTKKKFKQSLENSHLNDYKGSSNEHTSDLLSDSEIDVLKLRHARMKGSSESSIAGVDHLSKHEKDYISEKSVVENIPDSSLDIITSCSEGGRELAQEETKRFTSKNSILNSNFSIEDLTNKQVVNTNKRLLEEKEIIESSNLKHTKETRISQIVLMQNKDDKCEGDESGGYKNPTINKITVQGRNCNIILESASDKSPKTSHTSSSKNIELDDLKLDKNSDKTEVYINFCYEENNVQRSTSSSNNITSHDLTHDVNSVPQQRYKPITCSSRVALNSAPDSEIGSRQKGGFVKRCGKKMFTKNSKDIGKDKGKNIAKKFTYKIKRKGTRISSNKVTQCPSTFVSTGTQTQESSIYRDKYTPGCTNYGRFPLHPGHHHNASHHTHRMHQFQKPFSLNSRSSYPPFHEELLSRSSKPISSSSYHVPCNKGKENPQSNSKQKFSINLMGRNVQTERKLIKQEISTNRQKPLHQSSSMENAYVPHRSRSSKTTRTPSLSLDKSHKIPRMTPEIYASLMPLSKSMGHVCKHSQRYSSSSSDISHSSRRTRHTSPVRHSTRKECPGNYHHKYIEKASWKGQTRMPHGRNDEYFENTARSSLKLSHSQIFHNSKSSFVPYPNHHVKSHQPRPDESYYRRSKECPHSRFQESYRRSGFAVPSYYKTYGREFMS